MRRGFFVTVVCALTWVSAVRAAVISGPVVDPQNGHTYLLLAQEDWTVAESEAVSLGGTLATIRGPDENTFISNTFGGNRNLWIGLSDPAMDNVSGSAHAGNFVWASGDPSTYRNWSPGEPNNANGHNEWYVLMWGFTDDINATPSTRPRGTWNDVSDNPGTGVNEGYGVVELVPEPTSLTLAGAVSLALLARRRREVKSG